MDLVNPTIVINTFANYPVSESTIKNLQKKQFAGKEKGKNSFFRIAVMIYIFMLFSGCGTAISGVQNRLIGKWISNHVVRTDKDGKTFENPQYTTLTFYEDGTYSSFLQNERGGEIWTLRGKYRLIDDKKIEFSVVEHTSPHDQPTPTGIFSFEYQLLADKLTLTSYFNSPKIPIVKEEDIYIKNP